MTVSTFYHITLGAGYLLFTLSIAHGAQSPSIQASQSPSPAPLAKTTSRSDTIGSSSFQSFTGKVVETMNAANYTYVLVDTGKQKHWAAAPQFAVKVGDAITIEEGMPMSHYHSKTLNRDFEVIYFTNRARVGGTPTTASTPAATLPKGHPPITAQTAPAAKIDLLGIKKAEGGKTIAELFAAKSKLAGKPIKVRGKVVKFNRMIMGKNWLHLQDGSGSEGSNDLTLTTLSEAKVGDTVVATGKLATDKDFGYGYNYSVLLEETKLVIE
jgi:ribosomal protein S17